MIKRVRYDRNTNTSYWYIFVNTRSGLRYRTKKDEWFVGTFEEAQKEEERIKDWLKAKVDQKSEPTQEVKTFGDCLVLYKGAPMKNGHLRAIHTYQHVYDRLLKHLKDVPVWKIYPALKRYVDEMKQATSKGGTVYENGSINRQIAMAKGAVTVTYKTRSGQNFERLIPNNFLDDFPFLPENNIRYRILDKQERRRLYNNLPSHLKPIFYFAINVPARINELVTLKTTQVDLFSRLVRLDATQSKNKQARFLPIFEEMLPYFKKLVQSGSPWVFYKLNKAGEPQQLGRFVKSWYTACKKSGLDPQDYNWHKTRQQAAMQMIYDGWNEMEVMHIGGWKTRAAFTRYVKVDEIMIMKKLGTWQDDLTWKKDMAPSEAGEFQGCAGI